MEEGYQEGLEPLATSRRKRRVGREKVEEATKAARWRLLFQLDADENAGMDWGDEGRLYFWIREADLLMNRFADVWMVSQCH